MFLSPVYNRIKRAQTGLNGLVIISGTLQGLVCAGIIPGLFLLLAKMAGQPWATWRVWAIVSFMGCIIGGAIAFNRRLGMAEAARWLDNRLETREAFSAALVCLDHSLPGPFDEAVLLRADDWVGRAVDIPWPWKPTLRWAAAVLSMVAIISFLFAVRLPRIFTPEHLAMTQGQLLEEDNPASSGKPNGRSEAQSPKALAERLFPKNPRLARLMEEALRKGDTFALEQLFKEAEWDTDNMIDREIASADPGRIETQKQRKERHILSMARENGANASRKTEGSMRGNGKTGRESGEGRQGLTRAPDSRRSQQKTQGSSNGNDEIPAERQGKEGGRKGQKSSKSEQGDRGKGQQAGKGRGNVNKYWGDLTGPTAQTKAIISQRKDGPMLEYVLPGKKIRTPLIQTVPHAQRSAEAAMTKQEVPGEYEAFIRSYFLKLTQKSSGQSKKEGH